MPVQTSSTASVTSVKPRADVGNPMSCSIVRSCGVLASFCWNDPVISADMDEVTDEVNVWLRNIDESGGMNMGN